MKLFIKNLLSLILPITVAGIIPSLLIKNFQVKFDLITAAGFLFVITGFTLLVHTIYLFIRIGRGTLAPWSPTKKLVIAGIYKYVRNPMILGVIMILLGEAGVFHSLPVLTWGVCFFLLKTFYFIAHEEPALEKQFGNPYVDYKNKVGRWLPKFHL
jgi:protein-S-isoprenylcysteine O-methyltransferase Ste14